MRGSCRHKDGRRVHVAVTGSPIRTAAGEVVAIAAILRDNSERRGAEQARALLASIVESSDYAIHSVSLDGAILSWNRGAEALLGYTSQETIGKNAASLAPPCRRDEVPRYLEIIRKGCTIGPFERLLPRKDGREIEVSLSIFPIRNPAGEVVGAAAIAHDISQRLRAERKLRESEERFRGVFEQAPFGMCVSGLDGRFIQVNAAFCRMIGYSERELLSKRWADVTHPDDLGLSLQMKQDLSQNPFACPEAEKRYIDSSGRLVWVRIRVSVMRDSAGNPSQYVVHVEDITERKQAERALRESEDRFRIMADGCPTLMWGHERRRRGSVHQPGLPEILRHLLRRRGAGKVANCWFIRTTCAIFEKHSTAQFASVRVFGRKRDSAAPMASGGGWRRTRSRVFPQVASTWVTSASVRISRRTGRPSRPCRAAKRSSASLPRTSAKFFG